MSQYRTEFRPASEAEESFVIASLKEHTKNAGGVVTEEQPFSVLMFEKEQLIAAVIGKVFWNWLYADLVWVKQEFRGQGLGAKILTEAENKALSMELTGVYLWTESWQAPNFYSKLQYEAFVTFNEFPPGHKRYGYRKYLNRT